MALETTAERSVWQCVLNVYGLCSNCVEAYNAETGEYTTEAEHNAATVESVYSSNDRIVFIAAAVETGILFWIIGAFIYFVMRLLCANVSDGFQVSVC